MMSYSNVYDAIPICRTTARTEPVRKPKFSRDKASDKRQFCRSRCRSLCVHTLNPLLLSAANMRRSAKILILI